MANVTPNTEVIIEVIYISYILVFPTSLIVYHKVFFYGMLTHSNLIDPELHDLSVGLT